MLLQPLQSSIQVVHPDGQLKSTSGLAGRNLSWLDKSVSRRGLEEVDEELAVIELDSTGLFIFEGHGRTEDVKIEFLGGGDVIGEEGDGGDCKEGVKGCFL